MKMKTMNQVKAECVARIEKAFVKALVNAKDEADVAQILHLQERAKKPKVATLRELRAAAEIIEIMAEREG